jgi:NADH-quinone oxidoreductase subunit C
LLRCISAVDRPAENAIELSYELLSIPFARSAALKVRLDRTRPEIDSVSAIWPAANWHEREAYDLMGVHFRNHPDLRRILMPDDWVGHPLRKDYRDPVEYRGLRVKP